MSLERAHCVYLLARGKRGAQYPGVTSDPPCCAGRDGAQGHVWFEAHAGIHAALDAPLAISHDRIDAFGVK